MEMIFGYVRISTDKQNIERQVRNITAEYPQAKIIREVYTGKTNNRPEFNKLLKRLQSGDTIVFDSVSRMSRNAEEGIALYEELYSKGINLIFLKEPLINTETYKKTLQEKQISLNLSCGDEATDKLMNTIIEALNDYVMTLARKQIQLAFIQSQKEVDDLRKRTSEGIETAKRNGKQIGQREGAKLNVKKEAPIKELMLKYSKSFNGNLKDNEVIALINASKDLSVSRPTYYKYKADLFRELSNENGQ